MNQNENISRKNKLRNESLNSDATNVWQAKGRVLGRAKIKLNLLASAETFVNSTAFLPWRLDNQQEDEEEEKGQISRLESLKGGKIVKRYVYEDAFDNRFNRLEMYRDWDSLAPVNLHQLRFTLINDLNEGRRLEWVNGREVIQKCGHGMLMNKRGMWVRFVTLSNRHFLAITI